MPILPRWRTSSRRHCVVPPPAPRHRDAARFRRPPSLRRKSPSLQPRNPRKHHHPRRCRRRWPCRRPCPCRWGTGPRGPRKLSRSLPRRVHPLVRLSRRARDRVQPRSPSKARGRKTLPPHPRPISRRRVRRPPLNRQAFRKTTRPISIPSRPKWPSCSDGRRCRAKRIPEFPNRIESAAPSVLTRRWGCRVAFASRPCPCRSGISASPATNGRHR